MGFWAVIPAAGLGERMQSTRPKQYLPLGDKTILEQTLTRLALHPDIDGIVVAIAPNDVWWPELKMTFDCSLLVSQGGESRADSVLNALSTLSENTTDDPWVLVHDAARPCVRLQDIDAMLQQLAEHPVGGILGVPVTDTMKRTDSNDVISETVDRRQLWRACTPQMFRLRQLKSAIEQALMAGERITDEASAIEFLGLKPVMVMGHSDNIKITVPQDLIMAEWFLKQQSEVS